MSIQHQDSNPQLLEHELSPITTRPGLLPHIRSFLIPQKCAYTFNLKALTVDVCSISQRSAHFIAR